MMNTHSLTDITVDFKQALHLIKIGIKSGRVPYVKGSPGIAKSALGKTLAENHNCILIDLRLGQLEPPDLNGLPALSADLPNSKYEIVKRFGYAAIDSIPLEGDELPEGKDGYILFLDELPNSEPAVQRAAYKLILDRMVGQYKLHPNVAVIAAGNLITDNTLVTEELGTAIQSRLAPHLHLEVNSDNWLEWAYPAGITPMVTSYIEWLPGSLMKFDPNHNDCTFACPRTWEFVSDYATKGGADLSDPQNLPLICGTIGQGAGREFQGFIKLFDKLPSFESLIADPQNAPLPDEPDLSYALTAVFASKATETNLKAILTLIDRMEPEFRVSGSRAILSQRPLLKQEPAMKDWFRANSKILVY